MKSHELRRKSSKVNPAAILLPQNINEHRLLKQLTAQLFPNHGNSLETTAALNLFLRAALANAPKLIPIIKRDIQYCGDEGLNFFDLWRSQVAAQLEAMP